MRIYESPYESLVDWHEVSSPLLQEMLGPIYCEPPCDENKIHAEFEGEKFSKLYHKEIWLATQLCMYLAC